MAIANFFDKVALAASQILKGYNTEGFMQKLLKSKIEIVFDDSAVSNLEGRSTLDLLIRLLARLYPNITITTLGERAKAHKKSLVDIAFGINPNIDISESTPTTTVVIGNTSVERTGPVFYIGSNNWQVLFSDKVPVSSGKSDNPLAAGAAACFGAANIFRVAFGDQLHNGTCDSEFKLSLIDFTSSHDSSKNDLNPSGIDIGNVVLVGVGAVGNGALWALQNMTNISGHLMPVDDEIIDLTNLQRYVLATQSSIDIHKVSFAKSILGNTRLTVNPHEGNWASFVGTSSDWKFPMVLVAVDSARDRIAIQSSLPCRIINAWTQPEDLGISRHYDFVNKACLSCLYPPLKIPQSESQIIAGAFGLDSIEPKIRDMLYNNSPVTAELLELVSQAKSVSIQDLQPYCNLPIRDFYSKVICGGVVLTDSSNRTTETPMAFQSALAGILLVSELLLYYLDSTRTEMEVATRINLLAPITPYLNENILKPKILDCLCKDADFIERYKQKYILMK